MPALERTEAVGSFFSLASRKHGEWRDLHIYAFLLF
jgi:hypothetical protein